MSYLRGMDVSYAQSHTPDLSGCAFAFAKATEGTTVDPLYAYHMANFRKAHVVGGAYHYGVHAVVSPISAQVAKFLATAPDADLYALDIEAGSHTMTDAEAQSFIDGVRATGRRCGLYASASGYPLTLDVDFRWVAAYVSTPPAFAWDFWQYTSKGTPSGLDLDYFDGTTADLWLLLEGPVIAPTDQPTELVDLVAPPGGTKAAVYAEDFHTVIGSIGPTTSVKAYGIVRPRAAGAALTPVLGPTGSTFAGKVGWLGVDWVHNRRLPGTSSAQTVTVTGQGLSIIGPK